MPKKRLPPDDKLIQLYQDFSIAQIATAYNVSEVTVSKQLARILLDNPPLDPAHRQQREQMAALLKEGKNWVKIGRIMAMSPSAARSFARRNGLYTPPTELNFGLPIGCPNCFKTPIARGLCPNCYKRFLRRQKKNLVNYHEDGLLIFDHPEYKVFYTPKHGYQIHTHFFGAFHIDQPSRLERLLLDHLHNEPPA